MASTESTISEVRIVGRRYRWPAAQLNFWLLIMLIASCTLLGINASFLTVQNQLNVGVPWCVSRIPPRGPNPKIHRIYPTDIFSPQVLPLLDLRRVSHNPFPRPHPLADLAALAAPRDRDHRLLHPLRLVASRAHRHKYRVLGAHRECQYGV